MHGWNYSCSQTLAFCRILGLAGLGLWLAFSEIRSGLEGYHAELDTYLDFISVNIFYSSRGIRLSGLFLDIINHFFSYLLRLLSNTCICRILISAANIISPLLAVSFKSSAVEYRRWGGGCAGQQQQQGQGAEYFHSIIDSMIGQDTKVVHLPHSLLTSTSWYLR